MAGGAGTRIWPVSTIDVPKQFKKFFITMGGKEDIAYNNCQIMMKKFDEIGIKYEYFETPGGHTWPVWRESIFQFAQRIFK